MILSAVTPWIAVEPSTNPDAILGVVPFTSASVTFHVPTAVVPPDATGILVFIWAKLAGDNASPAYWHASVNVDGGGQNWFSMFIAADAVGGTTVNSQEFWLPAPTDGLLTVSLHLNELTSPLNQGQVEIHGYYPALLMKAVLL